MQETGKKKGVNKPNHSNQNTLRFVIEPWTCENIKFLGKLGNVIFCYENVVISYGTAP
jgi:hypothetical protein